MPGREKLPSTLKRSPPKAQRTWMKTHDSAVREYGDGSRGPSDPRAAQSGSKRLGIAGRSRMTKRELARAIARKQ